MEDCNSRAVRGEAIRRAPKRPERLDSARRLKEVRRSLLNDFAMLRYLWDNPNPDISSCTGTREWVRNQRGERRQNVCMLTYGLGVEVRADD